MTNTKGLMKDAIKKLNNYKIDYNPVNAGRVISANDGVLSIAGPLMLVDQVSEVKYGELLYISGDNYAIALNLEEDKIGAILLTDKNSVEAEDLAFSTGRIVSVPVGEALLGRVVNPLGEPIDGLGVVKTDKHRNIESPAPKIMDRSKVNEPLMTGIKSIDAMIPIGKGQRELIIGDRQTGKTAIAIDTIINQKGKNVICIYVAIGQKSSNITKIVHTLNEYDALKYTIIVSSTAKDPASLQYIAPYTGCAIGEEFMYNGRDVLIVYDDLSKHAVAYRTISLLLKRPPGREAYPGDIFYIHSRLLERASKLNKELGGGSMTALPIIETQAGDISAYIPTNVISITDGQIYLETELFYAGMRPAVNVGLSVSRVGGAAQTKAMKSVSGKLRLELAHYRELAVFAQFGADLDKSTSDALKRGALITEALKQEQYSPMSLEQQVLHLYATTNSAIKEISSSDINQFLKGFHVFMGSYHPEILQEIRQTTQFNEETRKKVDAALARHVIYFLGKKNAKCP